MNRLYKPLVIAITLAACMLMTIVMRIQGKPLQTHQAPKGIVSLEFAGHSSAGMIKTEWNNTAARNKTIKEIALNNILLDFIYISTYGLFLILLCLRSEQVLPQKKLLRAAAIMAFATGGLDVIENICMLYTLQKEALPFITINTIAIATMKFSLLVVIIFILAFTWTKHLLWKRNQGGYN